MFGTIKVILDGINTHCRIVEGFPASTIPLKKSGPAITSASSQTWDGRFPINLMNIEGKQG
jgi:hypothetical protein